ncbi:serine hydrolase domain-containing protein [Amycolatopsis sp. GM8]|uniref:serine hydrolase domain-containing protein n=1 Tax=Amycolatopsis sp. GM8 TaxID=2896530 RepID=UPI001F210658|nr:serine hydrolase domain-containing protein [Amycolatopsis sp. GM8]
MSEVIHGTVAPGYEAVRTAFRSACAGQGDSVVQLVAYVRGERVVDLWNGGDDAADFMLPIYSATKGAAYLVLADLFQGGHVDLDAPVCEFWPEFAAAGKEKVSVRELVSHRAGLIGTAAGFSMCELADDTSITHLLAAQEPYWEPGRAYGYHAFTAGALTNGLVRSVTGDSVQQIFDRSWRQKHGLDVYLGEPPADRVLPVLPPPRVDAPTTVPGGVDAKLRRIAFNQHHPVPTDLVELGNDRSLQEAGPASVGGVASARGLARMYAVAGTGTDGADPVIADEITTAFARLQTPGVDVVTGRVDRFAVGFEATGNKYDSLSDRAFGHSGAGGCEAFADPDLSLAYAYTRQRFAATGGEAPENDQLIRAIAEAATLDR